MKEIYYIDEKSIRYCYPYGTDQTVKEQNYGVLSNYIGKKFTRDEMDQIIAEMVVKHPYIENSMHLHLAVMRNRSYYYILDFHNYDYDKQDQGEMNIKYEK